MTSDPLQDTVIIPMLHSVLRDEDQWENAWTFNSENFLDQNGNFKKNPAFFAFSAGMGEKWMFKSVRRCVRVS